MRPTCWVFSRPMSFHVMPPSVEELRKRLIRRGTDSPEKIEMRVEKAASEILLADRFDLVIINDDLETACDEIMRIVTEFIEQ